MKIYKANILYTPTPQAFTVLLGGYVAVDEQGYVAYAGEEIPEQYADVPVTDF